MDRAIRAVAGSSTPSSGPAPDRPHWYRPGREPGIVRRLAAYALDCSLLFAVLAPVGFGIQALMSFRPETPLGMWLTILLNFSIPVWLFFIITDMAGGASPGKRAFGLRIATVHGGRLTVSNAIGRAALRLLPWELNHLAVTISTMGPGWEVGRWFMLIIAILLCAYAIIPAVTRGARGVHDYGARTAVLLK